MKSPYGLSKSELKRLEQQRVRSVNAAVALLTEWFDGFKLVGVVAGDIKPVVITQLNPEHVNIHMAVNTAFITEAVAMAKPPEPGQHHV